MRRIHLLLIATFAAFLAVAAPAVAATEADYTQAAFADAQKQGRPVLIHVNASWCPTCAKQRPIIAELAAEAANKDLLILKVDFDSQKDVVTGFGVREQSTLITFHGAKETGRSVGATDPAAIRTLVTKAYG
jgi:thioredoxin 1